MGHLHRIDIRIVLRWFGTAKVFVDDVLGREPSRSTLRFYSSSVGCCGSRCTCFVNFTRKGLRQNGPRVDGMVQELAAPIAAHESTLGKSNRL